MAGLAPYAQATLPEGAVVIRGDVNINIAGSAMTVRQTDRYGIVNWNSFSIGSGNSVHFNNGSGATLNRVTGLTASQIDGTLSATGSLYLLNRNGIIIGSDGRILTGGDFVGSTRDISDADFLDGGSFTLFGNSPAGVTNLGKITSTGGNILLAGYTVQNKGDLTASSGRVGLTAGGRIDVLTDVSWLGGAYAVSLGERGNDVTNEGRIQSLVAELRAHNGNIYALAGNNTGLIQATGVRNEGGRVILTADGGTVQSTGTITATRADTSGRANGGDIAISGVSVENYGGTQDVSGATGGTITVNAGSITTDTEMLARGTAGAGGSVTIATSSELLFTSAGKIDASGATAGGTVNLVSGAGANLVSGKITATASSGTGGTVNLLGDQVALLGGTVNASGSTGGGAIHVGGGYQGASVLSSAANASRVYVSDKSVLTADATGASGKGGTVVLWSDGTTEFAGKISARGGTVSGVGGLVETSGLAGLGVSGTVATGTGGTWLLDPKNITIGTVTDSIAEFQRVVGTIGGQPSDSTTRLYFGSALALSGETLVVGVGSNSSFAAFVFESGQIAARLTGTGTGQTYFGSSVAVVGDIVAVMAPGEFANSSFNQTFQGKAYIFAKGSGWKNGTASLATSIVNPTNIFGSLDTAFGRSGGTGTNNARFQLTSAGAGSSGPLTLSIADPLYDANGFTDLGAVFQYTIYPTSPASTPFPQTILPNTALQASTLQFGDSIVSTKGLTYVSYGFGSTPNRGTLSVIDSARSGAVQDFTNFLSTSSPRPMAADGLNLFVANTSSGTLDYVSLSRDPGTQQLFASSPLSTRLNLSALGGFGSVAVSGDTLLVGNSGMNSEAGGIAFYQKPAGGWGSADVAPSFVSTKTNAPVANTFNLRFGETLAIDGDYAVVGSIGDDTLATDRGAVFQFRRSGGTWSQSATLNPASPFESFNYGSALDIEGNTWVIGQTDYGDQAGTSNGRVYVYENGQLAATLTGTNDLNVLGFGLGYNVAISGSRIVATAPVYGLGSVYNRIVLFDKGSAWRNGAANLTTSISNTPSFQSIGSLQRTSLAFDGDMIAFGRPMNSGTSTTDAKGLVSLYQIVNNSIVSVATFASPINVGAANRDYFGSSLALSGNTLAVGSDSRDVSISTSGYIHLYEKTGASWSGIAPTSISVATVTGGNVQQSHLGGSLALDGNTLVAGYGLYGNAPVYVFERNGTWAASTTPAALLANPNGNSGYFGGFVDIDGGNIAVSGYDNLTSNALAFVYQKQDAWRTGTANLVANFRTPQGVSYFSTGPIAIDGDTILLSGVTPNTTASAFIPVSVFKGPYDFTSRATFGSNPGGTLNISAASLANSLSLGTDITLQANNDITVSSAITVNNPNGDGGNLTLSAGRRILFNASIYTDNGDLTLIAGDPRANATYRDAGERVVVLGRDTLNNSVTLSLGTGDLVINAADRFENRTGATDPFRFDSVNPGRFLVFSTTPDQTGAPDAANLQADLATAGRDFVAYGRVFDVNNPVPSGLPSGSGFLYSVQPALAVSVGNAAITFGQSASASLTLTGVTLGGNPLSLVTAANVFGLDSSILSGLVDTGFSSSVTLSNGGFVNAGSYVGGLTASARANVTTGPVLGVGVTTSGAGNLTVAKAVLDVRPDDKSKVYGSANPIFTAAYTGFVSGDSINDIDTRLSLSSTAVDRSNVGGYAITASGGLDNNYTFNVTGTGLLTIGKLDLALTGLSGVNRVYNATDVAQFTGTASIAPLSGDAVTLSGALSATAKFGDKNVGPSKTLTFSGFSLTGAAAGNYNLILPTNVTAGVTPASISATGFYANDKYYDGTTTGAGVSAIPVLTSLLTDQVGLTDTAVGTFVDKNAGPAKAVNITGVSLTGPDAANYVLAPITGVTAAILPARLWVGNIVGVNRVYDGTASAQLTMFAPLIAGYGNDDITLVGTPVATFADKNVGTDKPITVSGWSVIGADAANYDFRGTYNLTASITPATVTVGGISVADRAYDATNVATLAGTASIPVFGTDHVTVTGAPVATFADKNVGVAKPITLSGVYALTGDDAANYVLQQPSGLAATITPRPVTVTGITATGKVYDATTTVAITGTAAFSGILANDDATLDGSAFTYAFADKNAGVAKPIVISGLSILGDDAANYDVTTAVGLVATITPAPLSITGASATNRAYDATRVVAITGGTLFGVLGSDDIVFNTSAATGLLANKNIGVSLPVTVSGYTVTGADAANYTLAQPTGLSATITAFNLNLVGLSANKTYDGRAETTISITGLDAVFAHDAVTVDLSAVTAAYADKNAGINKDVTLSGLFALTGDDAGNYTLTQPASLTGTIARRSITVSGLTIANKIYDGTDTASISGTGSFGGTIDGDDLAIDVGAITVSFADKKAGVNKTVTLSGVTLSGDDADNYDAATPSGLTATIFKKDLDVTGLAATDKTYDRTTTAAITGTGVLLGVISNDVVTLNESARAGAFADKNAAFDKAVLVSGLSLLGDDALNYHIVTPELVADITRANATVTGLSAVGRAYDTTTAVALSGSAALDFGALNNVLVGSEHIALTGSATGAFADKTAAVAKAVTVSGLSLSGDDAANYTLVLPTALTATVTKADLHVTGASVAGKTYDGTDTATITHAGVITALGSDHLSLDVSAVTAAFAGKGAASSKAVAFSGYQLSGDDAANYTLISPAGVTAAIARAELHLLGIVANDKIYDGTNSAPLGGSLVITPFGNDAVSVAGTPVGTFADENAGVGKAITLSGLSLAGNDAANYIFVIPTLSADIERRTVTVTGLTANNRTYNGTNIAGLSGTAVLSNAINGDSLAFDLSAITATFADKHVGVAKHVTLSGSGLIGNDANNYFAALPFDLVATISAKELHVIGADAVDREYDRTVNIALTGGSLDGAINGDSIALVTASAYGTVTDRNVGANKAVTVSGYTTTGDDARNYTLVQPTGLDVTISQKTLELTGVRVADKFFDGTNTATISGGTLQGVVSGDAVSVVTTTGSGAFTTPEVGLNKPVALSGFTLSGADAANYRLPAVPTVPGNIIQPLKVITDIVPADVLRAGADATLAAQRAALVALNEQKPDTVIVADHSKTAAAVASGIPVVPAVSPALVSAGTGDNVVATYLAAASTAQAAATKAAAAAQDYRTANDAIKELGQKANANERALQTETSLRDTYAAQVAKADAELAKANENLATIAEAKRRIATLTQQAADAERLGRASESAAYTAAIAEARAIVATEAAVVAQRNTLAAESAKSHDALAAADKKIADLASEKAKLATEIATTEASFKALEKSATDAKAAATAAVAKLEQTRVEAEAAKRASLEAADKELAALKASGPASLDQQVKATLESANAATLAANYPLSPERAAAVAAANQKATDLQNRQAQYAAAEAEAKADLAAVSTAGRLLATGSELNATRLANKSVAAVEALDLAAILPDEAVLHVGDPALNKLADSATRLAENLKAVGTLTIGGAAVTPVLAANVSGAASGRGVADIDKPIQFDAQTETALKLEMQAYGLLPAFTTPGLAELPVATQLQLTQTMKAVVARKNELIAQGMPSDEATRAAFDAKASEAMTMVLFEVVDAHGIEEIPGVQEFVAGALGELGAQFGLRPSSMVETLMNGDLQKIAGAPSQAVLAVGKQAEKIFTDPAGAGLDIAEGGYEVIKAGVTSALGVYTSGGAPDPDKLAAAAKAAEARKRQLDTLGTGLVQMETNRQAAVAVRDKLLVQAKDYLVAEAQANEATNSKFALSNEILAAQNNAKAEAAKQQTAQVAATLSTQVSAEQAAYDAQLAAATAKRDAVSSQVAALAPVTTGGAK